MGEPIIVPANKLPVVERAIARALRPIRGSGDAQVKDSPNGVIIHVPQRKPPTPGITPRVTVTARLTGRDPTLLHRASWEQVERSLDGTATIIEEGRSGTFSKEPALELSKNPFASSPDPVSGDIVDLTRRVNSDGEIIWEYGASFLSVFDAFVLQDGGVAGDKFTDCTFTYEVRTIDNFTVATLRTPRRPRHPKTTYIKAPDFSIGLVGWNGPDNPILAGLDWAIDEIEKPRIC